MFDKIIPLWLKDKFHQSIWLITSGLILYNWVLPDSNILIQAFGQILTPVLGKITITLFLLLIGSMASIVVLSRKLKAKPNINDYDYIEDPGFYVHKKTKDKYCGNCIDKHDKLHRLSFDSKRGLICRPCGNLYISPQDYESAWKQTTQDNKSI